MAPPQSLQRIIDWADLNAPCYGTYSWNKEAWRKIDPDGEKRLRDHIRETLGKELAQQPFAALVNVACPELMVRGADLVLSLGNQLTDINLGAAVMPSFTISERLRSEIEVRARRELVKDLFLVLTYYETPEAEPVVLDNLVGEIRPSSQRTDLLPVYSFNGNGLWLAKSRTGNDKHVGHSSRLGPWRDVIARISDEYTR